MRRITPLTWATTVISAALAPYLVLTAENACCGLILAICAGVAIGLLNIGVHECWYKYKRRTDA